MSSKPGTAGSSGGTSVFNYIKRKHGTVLLHGGHQYYTRRKHNSGLVVWSCSQRKLKCSGVVRIKNDKIIEETPHKCTPDFEKNQIDTSLYNIKQKLITPSFPSVPNTYNSEVASLKEASTELLSKIPKFSSIKSSLYRYRNSAAELSKIQCRLVQDIQVPSAYQNFLLADYTNGNTRIIVFCSEKAKQIICQNEDFFADGTFKSCSPPFEQLYSIHGDIGSTINHTNLMPLVYALMSNRSTETYKILFMLIKAQIPKWKPKTLRMDYERAAMKAITQVFPQIEVKGCYFHYNKAIWAKGRELGLVKSKNIKKKRLVALSAVLPLLPQSEVMNGWAYITRHDMEDMSVEKFKIYMEKQWLKEKFIPIWNAYGQKHRTTNFLESWHHKLNSAVGKKGPNLLHLLNILLEDAAFYTVRSRQIHSNMTSAPARDEKYKQKDEFIHNAQIELTLGNLSVGHFLEMLRS